MRPEVARSFGPAERASIATLFAGVGLFATALFGNVSDLAATLEASLAALIVVLGYELFRGARSESSAHPIEPVATVRVIETSVLALLISAPIDWSVRRTLDPATVAAILVLAATALAGARRVRRSLLIDEPHAGSSPSARREPMEEAPRPARGLDLDRRPLLVFWETTRACLLACRHCRASAVPEPLPGELTTEEAYRFVESLTGFGRPYPVLVMTGGDVLMRRDAFELAAFATELGVPVAVAPSVTPRLTPKALRKLHRAGVKMASISLDGGRPETHDRIRGVEGHWRKTLEAIDLLRAHRFVVQVNTVVMRDTVEELPEIAAIIRESGAVVWEAFFLVQVGRGRTLAELDAEECEDVCHFLYDASRYGFAVRTVEAPFFRRVAAWRKEGRSCPTGPLYARLSQRLSALLGEPLFEPRAETKGTRDGKGIVFVAHDGDVYPAGFLPLRLGNVRRRSVVEIYRKSPLLEDIRTGRFRGRCRACEYADFCGGSRSRAYAATGDALGDDPACAYRPAAAPPGTA